MINYELARVAQQELGLYHITGERQMRQITSIFKAWMNKHSDEIDTWKDGFYTCHMGESSGLNFREVLVNMFMQFSREHDNHKWLTNNLS